MTDPNKGDFRFDIEVEYPQGRRRTPNAVGRTIRIAPGGRVRSVGTTAPKLRRSDTPKFTSV